MKFSPYHNMKCGGSEKGLAMLKGGTNIFHFLKGGHEKFYPVLTGGGGAQKVWDPQFSHFVAPPTTRN